MLSGALALAAAAAFAGSALYVNLVEQPARLALDDLALLSEWAPSDRRGVALTLAIALVAAACGLASFFATNDVRWAIGALVAIMSWPYAFFMQAPLNNQILTLKPKDLGATRALVSQWGLMEWGQTAIGLGATAVFIWAQ